MTADAGDSLLDSGCRRLSIRQRMQETLYQAVDAGDSIRQRIQETLLQTANQESLLQTADVGDSISDSGCRSLSFRQQMLETLNQTVEA